MNCPADAVPAKLRNDVKASIQNFTLDLAANVTGAKAESRDVHRSPKCSFGTAHQAIRSLRDFADADCPGGVCKKSIFDGDQVKFNEIAFTQCAPGWHAMNGLVIDADTNGAGKPVHL